MTENNSGGLIKRIAAFIVDKRNVFFLLYGIAFLFCLFSMGWVRVENDVTKYLPEETETRQGIEAMNAWFASFGTARIMVSNVTYDTAQQIFEEISQVDGVTMVTFDDTTAHYKDASALFDVNFAGGANEPDTLAAMETIRALLAPYDAHIDTLVGHDDVAMLREEMAVILLVGVVIIFGTLTLTSRAYAEVAVLLMTFGAAALLNMGTNYIFGTISFISDSVAVVLQLALAIDYAIILCHRFSDERETKPAREACVDALAKSIPEIGASSLTTISGLAALSFMKFRIGLDMSLVLMKSIFLSLLSVFTLMPGLLMIFSKLLDKTRHKKLLPNITLLGKFAVKSRRVLPVLFLATLVGAFYFSNNCPFCYSFTDLKTTKMADRQHAYFAIKDTFGTSNMVALLVPSGSYENEKMLMEELETFPEVDSTMGLANIEAIDGYHLGDAVNPRQLSELIGMDYEVVQGLYGMYAVEHDQYGRLLGGVEEFEVPLFDMFLFLKDQMDVYNITLEGEEMEDVAGMLDQLETARKQLTNEHYSRLVIYLNLPEESQETFDFLTTIRDVTGKYYAEDYYVIGNSTSSRDLASYFASDNLMISLLSAFFVIVVLLFTFRSAGMPVLLILVIQGSIWINFSFPTLIGQPLYFLGYLIVNAIQMGANIDYAIVISSHYQEQKQFMPHKEAIVHALNASFPTVFTSGTIMASSGMLIGNMSAQPVVSIMGTCIGRGTIISIFLVLFVLPSILVLGDSIIERTRFQVKGIELPTRTATGTMRVQGHVRGHIDGYVDGWFDGLLHGQLNAAVTTQTQITEENQEGAES